MQKLSWTDTKSVFSIAEYNDTAAYKSVFDPGA